MIEQILFLIATIAGIGLFAYQFSRIRKNIAVGRPENDRSDQPKERVNKMLLVAFGQQKMFKRPLPAVLHGIIYVGFLVINIEVLEIVVDGLAGTHRILGQYTGILYDLVMATNELLGALVVVASIIFLIRRNIIKTPRLQGPEMANFPKLDGNIILFTELILMTALFAFNTADVALHNLSGEDLPGLYPVSMALAHLNVFGTNPETLHTVEKAGWWIHILGIFAFLNYLPISKHFHIIMAFPNVYYSNLEPAGKLSTPEHIQHEVKAIFDFNYQVPEDPNGPKRFGVKDIPDLNWKNLMDAYTCTECGRCTSVCPANITGKKLSPRKIIMDTRDRIEEMQRYGLTPNENAELIENQETHYGKDEAEHTLLNHYITKEELFACTTCNACVEACPVNINHVSSIVEMRRYLAMEESEVPEEWMIMFNNIENNGAPWAMPAAARFDWANDVEMPE